MSKVPKSKRNAGKPWTTAQQRQLGQLAGSNTPTGVISLKLGRSIAAIRSRAGETGVSLKPVNRSPYNRRVG